MEPSEPIPITKRARGRPPNEMPERIDASPDEIAEAMFKLPANHQWNYLKKPSVKKPAVKPAIKPAVKKPTVKAE